MQNAFRLLVSILSILAILPSQAQIKLPKGLAQRDQWVTVVVDKKVPATGLTKSGHPFFRGRRTGRWTHSVDIWYSGDFTLEDEIPAEARKLPDDAVYPKFDAAGAAASGKPMLNGKPMFAVDRFADGARVVVHYRNRVGDEEDFVIDLWLWKYWGVNKIFHGEVMATCSNPTNPNLAADMPSIELTLGGKRAFVDDANPASRDLFPKVRFGNGQAMAFPITFVVGTPTNQEGFRVSASGLSKAWPFGTPIHPTVGFTKNPKDYVRNFNGPAWGPARFSGRTGAQEDQTFTCGDIVNPNSAQAIYLNAFKYANRPCHHLEEDGSIVDRLNHPNLVYWDGRVHWHPNVSRDRLGKPSGFWTNNQWSGPDVEHWLIGSLSAGDRWSPYYALDRLMEHQAHIYMMQWTHDDGLTTSQPYASRAVGWEGIAVSLLYEGLANRQLAERVKKNFVTRFEKLIAPAAKRIIDIRVDPRLFPAGSPYASEPAWMPWQQGIYAMGMDYAGRYFKDTRMVSVAVRASQTCLELDWFLVNGRWRSLGNQPVDPDLRREFLKTVDWSRVSTSFEGTWSLQPILVLERHSPSERSTAIFESLVPRMSASWIDETMVERYLRSK